MKKRKIKINVVLILILIIVLTIMAYCLFDIYNSLKSNSSKEVEVLDRIDGYEYTLDENDSKYVQELFKELKKTLQKDSIDEEAYAELISKLFITDFYSLEYATSKNDVGGVQFVYKEKQENFIHKAKDTIYKYVESNLYGKRTQELPVVKEVKITSIAQENQIFENVWEDENAYVVSAEISYEKDLGYPTECTLVLIHSNNILEVASLDS